MLLWIRGELSHLEEGRGGMNSASPNLPPSPARSRPSVRQQEGQTSFVFLVSFLFTPEWLSIALRDIPEALSPSSRDNARAMVRDILAGLRQGLQSPKGCKSPGISVFSVPHPTRPCWCDAAGRMLGEKGSLLAFLLPAKCQQSLELIATYILK